jgi:ferredoxin-NAD(P)+ reductase (naphthalene dioxygenase ferredoxin-specific)
MNAHVAPATYRIEIAPSSHEISCRSDQSLLDSCIQAGIPAPYNCRSGECGECVASLLRGEVYEMPGADPAVFNDAHRAAGKLLLCMCFPRSPIALAVPLNSDRPAIRPTTINTMVERVERVTPTIVQVSVETPGAVEYRAGQCFEWIVPGIRPNRIYSAANRPGNDRIDFHVRVYPGGRIGDHVVNALSPGQSLQLVGPFGQFVLSDSDWRPSICIAGGTGLAPIHAILDNAFARGDGRPIHFFYGARCQAELYCLDSLKRWEQLHSTFTFTPVLSDEPSHSCWTGARGLVTDAVAERLEDAFGLEAYVCGPSAMLDAAVAVLEAAGLSSHDIHADRFVQSR